MKIFIYDKFWDAFVKINRTTQNKVTDFMSKFRENSKSAALNLESINTFKDKSLRTARIDQKYRVVLKEVIASEEYLLLWIDNHDEAMDWAKNKMINWNENTQAYQVFKLDDAVVEPDPIIQHEQFFMAQYGKVQLLEIGVPEVLIPSVLGVNNFEDLEKLEDYLPLDVFENLFYLLDGANYDVLLTEIREGLSSSDKENSKNNSRSFIELTDDEILNEAITGCLNKWKYYLHPSQAKIVNSNFNGPVKVSGAAGTGKTIAALHRLKFLVNSNTIDKPILFTTFTKELSENLKNLASELIDKTNSYAINNIDSLAFDLAKNYKLLSDTDKIFGFGNYKTPLEIWEAVLEDQLTSYDENFLCDEFENVILNQQISNKEEYFKASRVGRGKPVSRKQRFEIWDLIEKFLERKSSYRLFYKEEVYNLVSKYLLENEIHVFSHVIVDELQDFSNVELKFIRSLVESKENDLFLVGDPLQNIYNKKINFSKLGINIRGNRSKRLKINYRTTEEIKKFAFKVIKNEVYDDFDNGEEEKSGYLSLFHGIKPTYETFNDKEEELFSVYNQIIDLLSEGYHYNDIVVAARTKDGVNDFRNYFHKMKLPYQDKHLLNNKLEGVRLSTFHGLKGLEFKHVFLVNVNDRTFPLKFSNFNSLSEQEQLLHLRGEKSLMYVASSRAILSLNVTGTGSKSVVLNY